MTVQTATTAAPSTARVLARAAAMEWTKLSSVRTTWWCIGLGAFAMGAFALLMGLSAVDRIEEDPDAASGFSYVQLTSQGVFYLVQFVVLTLAALAATNEYANRAITATLLAVPRRGVVLAARTIVTAGVAFAAGAAITALGIGVLWLVIGSYTPLDLAYAMRTVLGAGVCMAVFAVLFVGLGTAMRGIAGTIGVGFLLLLGIPLVLQLSGSEPLNDLAALLPGFAGVEFYASGDAGFYTAPHDGAVNLVSVLGWAAAAQLAGYAELRARDV
ncbi:ABC-2 type transport system permease protein [Murinocardiopsis flavida]|uniref:ABC-2 type transport system permease protein n=1 Tax=Murinocardiopsis flavida TaxID=645275 RepID=A0A2P8DDZ6_9ACTN|nr:ABC transporter permease [Murinocardiopsis flavida]PSK95387.1 ABC-2 type transport system permease protein [Murinocardiopsis flavida]